MAGGRCLCHSLRSLGGQKPSRSYEGAPERAKDHNHVQKCAPGAQSPSLVLGLRKLWLPLPPCPFLIPLQTEMSSCTLEISNLPSNLSQVSSPETACVAGLDSHPSFLRASSSFVLAHHPPQRLCAPLPRHQLVLSWSRLPTSLRRGLERNLDTSQEGGKDPGIRWGRKTRPLSLQIPYPSPSLSQTKPEHPTQLLLTLCALSREPLGSTGLLRIYPRTKTHLRGPSCA